MLLPVIDRAQPLQPEDVELLESLAGRPALVVLNKADLPACLTPATIRTYLDAPVVDISPPRAADCRNWSKP